MKRRAAELESTGSRASSPVDPALRLTAPPAPKRAPARDIARYGQDLEARYIAARDAWLAAMRTAASGRPADMASLAIAQEAYEAVATEREHWLTSGQVAIPVEAPPKTNHLEIAVGQELEWRRVLAHETRRGLFSRIKGRFSRH